MIGPKNPPAFPVAWGGDLTADHGMGLREYFAGQMIAGVDWDINAAAQMDEDQLRTACANTARLMFMMVDAMVAESLKEPAPVEEERPPFTAWCESGFANGDIVEVRERDGHEHPMKVGSMQFQTALRDLGERMPVRAATKEQRAGWGQ